MKKLVLLSALTLFVTALFFTACKKDQDFQTQANELANSANPYDLVGVKHNEGLTILAQNKADGNYDIAQRFQVLADHGFGTPDRIPTMSDYGVMIAASDPIRAAYDQLKKDNKVSENLYNAMMSLNNIVRSYAYTDELTLKVKDFEAGIPSLGLTEKENKTLYVAASIARYSSHYWQVNKYGANAVNADRRPTPRSAYILACDILGGAAAAETGVGILVMGEAAAVASELGANWWDFWNKSIAPGGGSGGNGPFSIHWGCSSYNGECTPGRCMICNFTADPLPLDLFTATGPGYAVNQNAVFFDLDGSKLDAEFIESLKTGIYNLGEDYTVSQDIVEKVYEASGLQAPKEETVLPKGDKQVIYDEETGTYSILIPVTYQTEKSSFWLLMISPK